MKAQKPILHGDDHLPGHADPIHGLIIGSGATGTYVERVLAEPSLVAYWPMSDAGVPMQDLSPNDIDLTTSDGTPTFEQPGPMPDTIYPYAVALDGPNGIGAFEPEYVGAGSLANFNFSGTSAFTFECMAYATSFPATLGPFFGLQGGSDSFAFGVTSLGKPRLYRTSGGTVTGTTVLNLSQWVHVAVTFDGTTAKCYFDGTLVDSGASAGSVASASKAVRVGGYEFPGSGTKCSWQGSLAHAAIYNTALTADEIAGHSASVLVTPNEAEGKVLTADGAGGADWEFPTVKVDGTRYDEILAGTGLTSTDNTDGTVTLDATGGTTTTVATDTIWDAKGDLAAAIGADTAARLPVGSNGQVLTADSAQTTGVKWATVTATFDPSTATTWWFPLADSDGLLVLDDNLALIPTLIPL